MKLNVILSAAATVLSTASLVNSTPVPCTDLKRDAILTGKQPPEICCPYGKCKGDVVISMG